MKKKQVVKICAIVLASLLAVGMLVPAITYIFAADEKVQTKEVPLLVLIVSFDANGNGKNDYSADESNKLFADPDSALFGEQWAKTKPEDYYDSFFGKESSLADYFYELSCGKIKYVPAKIDTKAEGWSANDGIIPITVNSQHPSAYKITSPATYKMYCAKMVDKAVDIANQYVDFSKFDENKDGEISAGELRIVVINAGCDETASAGETLSDELHFTSKQALYKRDFEYDNVKIRSGSDYNMVAFAEYSTPGKIMTVGQLVHGFAQTLGAADIGNNGEDEDGKSDPVEGWPLAYKLSLLCDGYKLDNGKTPSYADPYARIKMGFTYQTLVKEDGEYTLYSTKSGKYNVLCIPTPDSDEYFLVELRRNEGYDKFASTGTSGGGVMVWHIDEGINKTRYSDGYSCTSIAVGGEKHDPGIVPLVRTGWNKTGDSLTKVSADDLYYYISSDASTSVFDSSKFSGAASGSVSLNSYPASWEKNKGYNVHIEVLSESEDSVKIKIVRNNIDLLPRLTASCTSLNRTTLTVTANIYKEFGENIESCGVILSKNENPTEENGKKITGVPDANRNFYVSFDSLDEGEKYYYKAYVTTPTGTSCSDVGEVRTKYSRDYYFCYMYRNISEGESPVEIKCSPDKPISYDFAMVKPGYRFVGWFTDAELKNQYDMNTIRSDVRTDLILFAKWEKETETTTTETTTTVIPETTTTKTTTTTETTTTVSTTTTTVTETTTTTATETETTSTQPQQTTTPGETSTVSTSSSTNTGEKDPGDEKAKNTLIIALCIAVVILCAAFITTLGLIKKKR